MNLSQQQGCGFKGTPVPGELSLVALFSSQMCKFLIHFKLEFSFISIVLNHNNGCLNVLYIVRDLQCYS